MFDLDHSTLDKLKSPWFCKSNGAMNKQIFAIVVTHESILCEYTHFY